MKIDIDYVADDTLGVDEVRVGEDIERPIPGRNRIELTVFHHPDNRAIDTLAFADEDGQRGTLERLADHPRVYADIFHTKDYFDEVAFVSKHCSVDSVPATSLVIGCGPGSHSKYLTRCGFDVTGIDPSAEMVSRARQHVDGRFIVGGLPDLPVDSTFDLVWCPFGVINYVEPASLEETVEELAYHVASGGSLVVDCCFFPHMTQPNIQFVVGGSDWYVILYEYSHGSSTEVNQRWDVYRRDDLITERNTLYNHSFERLERLMTAMDLHVDTYDWYGKPSTLPDSRLLVSNRA